MLETCMISHKCQIKAYYSRPTSSILVAYPHIQTRIRRSPLGDRVSHLTSLCVSPQRAGCTWRGDLPPRPWLWCSNRMPCRTFVPVRLGTYPLGKAYMIRLTLMVGSTRRRTALKVIKEGIIVYGKHRYCYICLSS